MCNCNCCLVKSKFLLVTYIITTKYSNIFFISKIGNEDIADNTTPNRTMGCIIKSNTTLTLSQTYSWIINLSDCCQNYRVQLQECVSICFHVTGVCMLVCVFRFQVKMYNN